MLSHADGVPDCKLGVAAEQAALVVHQAGVNGVGDEPALRWDPAFNCFPFRHHRRVQRPGNGDVGVAEREQQVDYLWAVLDLRDAGGSRQLSSCWGDNPTPCTALPPAPATAGGGSVAKAVLDRTSSSGFAPSERLSYWWVQRSESVGSGALF